MIITPNQRSIVFSAFCLLLFVFSSAQRYSFRNYTVAQGLGSSSVNHIFQDSKGYLWFATQGGGASRFNGKEFKNFTRADGLISNDVTYITEDATGNIWIGTAAGASMLSNSPPTVSGGGRGVVNYNQSNGLTGAAVYCIYAGADKIYFATEDAGVKFLNSRNGTYSPPVSGGVGGGNVSGGVGGGNVSGGVWGSIPNLPSGEVYTIAADKYGSLFFGLASGIAKYTNGKTAVVGRPTDNLNGKSFFSSMTDADGNIWFGSMTGDVLVIHSDNSIEKVELPSYLKNDFIGSIEQDVKGNIWLATDHGLLKYTGKEFKLFSEREGLSVNTVQAVRCDYEGNIWTGTLSGGVNLLSSEAFMHYTEKDGLSSATVTAICPAPKGKTYYIGTGEGLYIFNPSAKPSFVKTKAVEKINISSLAVDGKEQLWISAQQGVFVLKQKGCHVLK